MNGTYYFMECELDIPDMKFADFGDSTYIREFDDIV